MVYTEQLINKETKYLIEQINVLLREHNSPNYVEVIADYQHLKDDMLIVLDFNYILQEPHRSVEVLTTSARVDPEYFFVNENEVLESLNSSFFIEILRHTEFNAKIHTKQPTSTLN